MASAPPESEIDELTNENKRSTSRDHNLSVSQSEMLNDGTEDHRECFRKLTKHIVSFETLDDLCDESDAACSTAVRFLQDVPVKTRSAIAKYLSSGKASHLNLSVENFHDVFHIAKMLHLQQLNKICMDFCDDNNAEEILSLFENCSLQGNFIRDSQIFRRSMSVFSDKDEKSPQEFYCAFSRRHNTTAKGEGEVTSVIVIDISEKIYAYNRETKKLGKATACCSTYTDKDNSPYIFVCGGEDKSADLVWKYDILLGIWHKCAKLLHGRSRHNMVADGCGSIYAIGGMDVACIEKYSVVNNKWKEISVLKTRVNSATTALYKGKIYIFGGKTTSGSVATVQRFDIVSSSVRKLNDLPCAFFGGESVLYGEKIFIATTLGHMICFEPEVEVSFLCAQQLIVRKYFGMFVKNERIYIVGGVSNGEENDGDCHTPMLRYNPVEDRWRQEDGLAKSFPVFSACTVSYSKRCSVIPFRKRN